MWIRSAFCDRGLTYLGRLVWPSRDLLLIGAPRRFEVAWRIQNRSRHPAAQAFLPSSLRGDGSLRQGSREPLGRGRR